MATTRKDLRQQIGQIGFCADMESSTCTNGSPTTATWADTSLTNSASLFVNASIYVLTGSAAGNERAITGYAAQVITPSSAFSANATSGDTAEIHRRFPASKKNEAINAAIRESKSHWAKDVFDTSLTWTTNTYTYNIGALTVPVDEIFLIDKIQYDTGESGTGYPYADLDDDLWEILDLTYAGTAATLKIQFHETVNGIIANGKTIRLVYRVRPSVFTADTGAGGTLAPDNEGFAEYIRCKASQLLYEKLANDTGEKQAQGTWRAGALIFKQKADAVFTQDAEPPEPGRVIFPVFTSETYAPDNIGTIRIP